MKNIDEFNRALNKKSDKKLLSYTLNSKKELSEKEIKEYLHDFNIPQNIVKFLLSYNGLVIHEPRLLKILHFDEIRIIEGDFLFFALINETEKICFDISGINSADEFNIISYENKFVITKTLSSFLTNKIWAWIDRGRTIWKEEFYD